MFLDIPCIYVIHNNRTFSAAGLWFSPDTPGLFDRYLIFTLYLLQLWIPDKSTDLR